MANLIELSSFGDARGRLSVIDQQLPFTPKRVYWIYNASGVRGGHRHHVTRQVLVCVAGSCDVYCDNSALKETFSLDNPGKCLLVEPQDWHTMSNFSPDAVLLVLASHSYDKDDYIDEAYE
jgi:mannose-6-phosphate isomerase-like protein (cupin superfamily)